MNVLLMFWGGGEGGDASATIELASALKSRGIDFKLVAYGETHPSDFVARAQRAGLKLKEDLFMISSPENAWEESGLKQADFDVVHVHHGRTIPKKTDIVPLRKLAGRLPLALTAHGPLPLGSIDYGGLKSRLSRWISPVWFKKIIVPSESKRREWREFTPFSAKVICIPNIVPPLKQVDRNEAREQLGILIPEKVVLYCSRLDEEKDPLTFIKAIAEVAKKQQVIGLIAGSGGLAEECKALACELQAPIRFLGHVQDVAIAYSAADVFVQSSLYESFGITMLQALQMGIPTVASDIPIFRELYAQVDGISWFKPGDSNICASQIVAEVANPHRPELSHSELTADAIVDAHLKLWHEVSGKK
jgi:glycosyltransferase involved in cell wall biosynthesis